MPLYEYQCSSCKKTHEMMQKFSDPPLETCPECGGPVTKLVSLSSFALKGAGWYTTDYKKSTKPAEAKDGDAKPAEAKSGDAKPGDAKPGAEKPGAAKPAEAASKATAAPDTKSTASAKPAPDAKGPPKKSGD